MATHENDPDLTGPQRAEPAKGASPDEIEADIERTREELGETVEALTDKLDVKTRVQQKFAVTKEQALAQADVAKTRATELAARARDNATDDQGQVKPAVLAVGAAALAVAVVMAVAVLRRGRSR